MIANRHIRHDWNTFVDWEQISVRTLCGVTTKRHLAGIPGVTPQDIWVEVGDRKRAGWCVRCSLDLVKFASAVVGEEDETILPIPILYLYLKAAQEVFELADRWYFKAYGRRFSDKTRNSLGA